MMISLSYARFLGGLHRASDVPDDTVQDDCVFFFGWGFLSSVNGHVGL